MQFVILWKTEQGRRSFTGADIPELAAGIVIQAFEMLDQADVVVGADDGGYYLIGMSFPCLNYFATSHGAPALFFLKRSGRLSFQEKAAEYFQYFQTLILLKTLICTNSSFRLGKNLISNDLQHCPHSLISLLPQSPKLAEFMQ